MFASSYCSTTVRPLGLFSLPDFAMQKSWGYPPPPHPPFPAPSPPFYDFDEVSINHWCSPLLMAVSPRAENFKTVAPECFARSLTFHSRRHEKSTSYRCLSLTRDSVQGHMLLFPLSHAFSGNAASDTAHSASCLCFLVSRAWFALSLNQSVGQQRCSCNRR